MHTSIGHNWRMVSADAYARPLLNLDEGLRVEIMHILLNSITTKTEENKKKKYDLYTCFGGSWGEGSSTENYCKELREGISEPREIDAW